MRFFSYRILNLAGFLLVGLILGMAAYLQVELHQQPCLLCVLQRLVYVILGALFLFGSIYQPYKMGQRIHGTLLLIVSLTGLALAMRQVYLQHLPPGQQPGCTPGFYYLLHNFPLSQSIQLFFRGSGDCSLVTWRFWQLSIAEWSLIFFIIFAVIGLIELLRKR